MTYDDTPFWRGKIMSEPRTPHIKIEVPRTTCFFLKSTSAHQITQAVPLSFLFSDGLPLVGPPVDAVLFQSLSRTWRWSSRWPWNLSFSESPVGRRSDGLPSGIRCSTFNGFNRCITSGVSCFRGGGKSHGRSFLWKSQCS